MVICQNAAEFLVQLLKLCAWILACDNEKAFRQPSLDCASGRPFAFARNVYAIHRNAGVASGHGKT